MPTMATDHLGAGGEEKGTAVQPHRKLTFGSARLARGAGTPLANGPTKIIVAPTSVYATRSAIPALHTHPFSVKDT